MSQIDMVLDKDGTGGGQYDRLLAGCKKPITSIRLLTRAMPEGRAAVLLVAGETRILLTGRIFLEAAAAVKGAHPKADERASPELPPGTLISGEHRGHKWQALHMEHVYVVSAECAPGKICIAGDETIAEGFGKTIIDGVLPGQG